MDARAYGDARQGDVIPHQDQLRFLAEVSEAIASHSNLTALFRDLARRLPPLLPFEVIALFLHDPDKQVMRVDMLGTADADRIPPGLELPVDGVVQRGRLHDAGTGRGAAR